MVYLKKKSMMPATKKLHFWAKISFDFGLVLAILRCFSPLDGVLFPP